MGRHTPRRPKYPLEGSAQQPRPRLRAARSRFGQVDLARPRSDWLDLVPPRTTSKHTASDLRGLRPLRPPTSGDFRLAQPPGRTSPWFSDSPEPRAGVTSPRPPRRLRLRGRGYDSPADARDKSPGPGLRHPDPGMMSHTYAGCLSPQAQARLARGDLFIVKQGDVPRTGRKGYSSSQYKRGPSPFTPITIPA